MPNVVEHELTAVTPDGKEAEITIAVGTPYRRDDGEWACQAATLGLDGEYPDIVGTDALQALCLALSLIRLRLTAFLQEGGRLFSGPRTNSHEWNREVVDAIFSRVGDSPTESPEA